MRIGIDFGTTRTVVAGIDDGNYPVCAFDWEGQIREHIPTLVAAQRGRILFGWEAARAARRGEASLLRGLKRLTATTAPDAILSLGEGVALPLIEILTGYLAHVREMIQRYGTLHLKGKTLEAMVATPANANSNQRYLTLEAFHRAGFQVLEVLNEPSAAALEHVHRYLRQLGQKSPKEYVVVYDLGGGTFDTAAVRFSDGSFDVLSHEGIARLGGEDFDSLLLELALGAAVVEPASISDSLRARLLEECRERKEGLTTNTRKIAVDLALPEGETTVVLDTFVFYEACEPVIEPSVAAVERVLASLGGEDDSTDDPRRLAAVYLVGGSTAFPPVARRLREAFGRKIKHAPSPFAATAVGLAIAADPAADVRIQDSVSRHFGVWREGSSGRDKIFDMLIPKDTQLDQGQRLEVVRRYCPAHNLGCLRFLECGRLDDAGQPAGDLSPWPEIFFPYDPCLAQADVGELSRITVERRTELQGHEIQETYRYEPGGILSVDIQNLTAGYGRTYSLAPLGAR
ncbi:MAG: Hsp70 family protein [Polyangia bacterium]|jgi:molecular chaperone DnaK (HSP70)|nr:Hsp70 family protein [Polyangia bacterium]